MSPVGAAAGIGPAVGDAGESRIIGDVESFLKDARVTGAFVKVKFALVTGGKSGVKSRPEAFGFSEGFQHDGGGLFFACVGTPNAHFYIPFKSVSPVVPEKFVGVIGGSKFSVERDLRV